MAGRGTVFDPEAPFGLELMAERLMAEGRPDGSSPQLNIVAAKE